MYLRMNVTQLVQFLRLFLTICIISSFLVMFLALMFLPHLRFKAAYHFPVTKPNSFPKQFSKMLTF